MATHYFRERVFESCNVEIALDTDCEWDIVKRTARLQLVQETGAVAERTKPEMCKFGLPCELKLFFSV